ncbi:MAG: hypothetical protein CO098_00695, partial [Bacteroidetes bacterium CG_4_9_14_3_um_filter_41_19]
MDKDFNWIEDEELKELIDRFNAMLQQESWSFFDVDDFEILIDFFLEFQDVEYAAQAIAEAQRQHPNSNAFQVRSARLLAAKSKYYEALEQLNELELTETPGEEIFLAKGEIYSLMNKHELAIEEFRKSIPFSESPEEVYAAIAFEFENMDDYTNAILNLKEALRVNPAS